MPPCHSKHHLSFLIPSAATNLSPLPRRERVNRDKGSIENANVTINGCDLKHHA